MGGIPDLSSTSYAPRADKFENIEREVHCEAKPPQGFLSLCTQSESVLFLLMKQKKGFVGSCERRTEIVFVSLAKEKEERLFFT